MTQVLRTVIVDDERSSRDLLRILLSAQEGIRLVGEAGNLDQAVQVIESAKPDVVFLDVQLRAESGFDLFDRMNVDFKVVFVSAFDKYAARAFEVNALDYIVKPVDKKRLDVTLGRLFSSDPNPKRKEALEYDDRVFLKLDDRSGFLKISKVKCIFADGYYSVIRTTDHAHAHVNISLKEWEERLPDKFFRRVHRSAIVNLEYVVRVEEWFNYTYRIFLQDVSEPIEASRRYAAKLREERM